MTGLLLALVLQPSGPAPGPGAVEPAAIVCAVSGKAHIAASGKGRPVRLFDWLDEGSSLSVASGSSMTLVFRNGTRYALGARAHATLGAADLAVRSGDVRRLADLPVLPSLPPIRDDEHPGRSVGAVRLRDDHIQGLYPRRGTTALADAALLRFDPVEGAALYRVEVVEEGGHTVFQAETAEARVSVPQDALKPGHRYTWSVTTGDGAGWSVRGDEQFATLPENIVRARAAFREAAQRDADPAALALLAEVDRLLGLLSEAQQGFGLAADRLPGNSDIRRALARMEQNRERTPDQR